MNIDLAADAGPLSWGWLPAALTAMAMISLGVSSLSSELSAFAASVLLIVPGFLAIFGASREEHPLVTDLVFWIRALTLTPGVLAVVAAISVVTGFAVAEVLIGTGAVTAIIAAALGVGHLRSRVTVDPDELGEFLDYSDLTRVA